MPAKNSAALTVTTPTERKIVMTRVFDAPRRLVFEAWTSPEHLPHWLLGPELDHAGLRDRLPPGRGVAFRLAPFRRQGDGNARLVSGGRAARAAGLYRVLGRRLAGNDQHGRPLRGRWQDDALVHNSVPVKGSSRRRAQDGDEGRRGPELRSSCRAPRGDGAGKGVSIAARLEEGELALHGLSIRSVLRSGWRRAGPCSEAQLSLILGRSDSWFMLLTA